MRKQGEGGQKPVKFCGRPLWMAPKQFFIFSISSCASGSSTLYLLKQIESKGLYLLKLSLEQLLYAHWSVA